MELDGHRVEVLEFGHGPQHLLAFHGFGQDASVMHFLQEVCGDLFTIHSFSLFHHGNSQVNNSWGGARALPPDFYNRLVRQYTASRHIDRFSLAGNSLGGRICFSVIEGSAARVDHLFLFAPDGVKKSFWYGFATHSALGKKLFRRAMQKPEFFFRVMKVFRFLGLLGRKMEKFVLAQFSVAENRERVFNVWNMYADIQPPVGKVRSLIVENRITGCIFTGRYDPVLDRKIGEILTRGIEKYMHWKILETGHQLFKAVWAVPVREEIKAALQRK